MAGPGLSTTVTAATAGHPAASNAAHGIANAFDTAIGTSTTNYVLAWNGSVYVPMALLSVLPAGFPLVLHKSAGVWPGVPTTRTDVVIFWAGPDPSPAIVSSRTLGVAGMLDNVDKRLVSS